MPRNDGSGPVVGLIGLGNMGGPMAAHLKGVAGELRLFDARAEVTARVAEETGGRATSSLAELGRGADIVITMLPNAGVVRAVVLGEGGEGLADALSPGAIVVDMSSSFPPATKELGAALKARGIALLDAPVSGGVRKAIAGTLAIMLGGDDAAALDRAEPVLASMGRIIRTGPLGSGHAVKALNNFVSAAGLAAAAEAVIVGEKFGLDPGVIVDVLNASTGRNNSTEVKMHQFVLNRAFNSGFALDLMAKDIKAAADLAEGLGLEMPNLAAAAALWREAQGALGEGADHTEIARYLAPREDG